MCFADIKYSYYQLSNEFISRVLALRQTASQPAIWLNNSSICHSNLGSLLTALGRIQRIETNKTGVRNSQACGDLSQ